MLTLLVLALFARGSGAKTGRANAHLELGATHAVYGWQRDELGPGIGGMLGGELAVMPLLGIQAYIGGLKFFDDTNINGYKTIHSPYLFRAGLGVRLRPINDETGYLWAWKKRPDHVGNIWGNLFVDLGADYFLTGGRHRFGANLGVGYELSVINGLQMGPVARVIYLFQKDQANERLSQDGWFVFAGLSVSLAVPPTGKRMEDVDGDGLYPPTDQCPDVAEDKDGYKDQDGCADSDNDDDGILDANDKCPFEKEDFDGFGDEDGCPEKDNDLDGLADGDDKCPDEKEDFDRFADEDGCPDTDNDGDKILDTVDKCPNEPETFNKFEDEDGCPEKDSDGDGVFDIADRCPGALETINGIEDEDGCPDEGLVQVQDDRILLGERIFFDMNMARIKTRGKAVLEQLAALIQSHPEYQVITIEGHADRTGKRSFNQRLSEARAESVKSFLIGKGVDSSRLKVVGFGSLNPWKRGVVGAGWQNRRVEVVIDTLDDERGAAKATMDAVKKRKHRDSKATK